MPMTNQEHKPHDANILKVCLDDLGQNDFCGRIISRYIAQPEEFVGVAAMLTKMEEIMDLLGYPQKYRKTRSFNQTSAPKEGKRIPTEMVTYLPEENFARYTGAEATFVVRVVFRQNATWQGSIQWEEQEQRLPFDSTLEMVKLMDNAAQRLGGEKTEKKSW